MISVTIFQQLKQQQTKSEKSTTSNTGTEVQSAQGDVYSELFAFKTKKHDKLQLSNLIDLLNQKCKTNLSTGDIRKKMLVFTDNYWQEITVKTLQEFNEIGLVLARKRIIKQFIKATECLEKP